MKLNAALIFLSTVAALNATEHVQPPLKPVKSATVTLLKPETRPKLSQESIELISTNAKFNKKYAKFKNKLRSFELEEALAVNDFHDVKEGFETAIRKQEKKHLSELRELFLNQIREQRDQYLMLSTAQPPADVTRTMRAQEEKDLRALIERRDVLHEQLETYRANQHLRLYSMRTVVKKAMESQETVGAQLKQYFDRKNKVRLAHNEALRAQANLKRQRRS